MSKHAGKTRPKFADRSNYKKNSLGGYMHSLSAF